MKPLRGTRPALRTDRRGVVLTVAVIIVTTLVASGLLVSGKLVRTFYETRNLYLAIPAYYAAESGAERALQVLRVGRADPDAELCTGHFANPCNNANDVIRVIEDLATLPAGGGSLSVPGVSYTIDPAETTSLEGAFDVTLRENETTTLALFPPVQAGIYEGSGNNTYVGFLKLQKPGGVTVDPKTWLEVRWIGFSPSPQNMGSYTGFDFRENGRVQLVGPAQLAAGTPWVELRQPVSAECQFVSTCYYTLVQLRPLYGDLGRLTISPLSVGSNPPAGIPAKIANRAYVYSVGTVASGAEDASAVVKVSTSWRLPASGFFTYTVFSESDLTK